VTEYIWSGIDRVNDNGVKRQKNVPRAGKIRSKKRVFLLRFIYISRSWEVHGPNTSISRTKVLFRNRNYFCRVYPMKNVAVILYTKLLINLENDVDPAQRMSGAFSLYDQWFTNVYKCR